ncbi:MAG TPA: cytochrome c biogenesis protein CcsA [Polyangiaceae bacterium]|nr:cytochrome c biogenesis protein CcsA [Polyangiaceae bacterium]
MERRDLLFNGLVAVTAIFFAYLIYFIFAQTPAAQLEAGGIAQKIFYFHVPAAYAMYLSGAVCFVASAAYLVSPSDKRDAWARAGAEVAVAFGAVMLISGPLWAKKAWGVYWAWEPRLVTTLLSVLIYIAVVVLRAFAGDGEAERKFAAALGVLGTVNLPIIHYSVQKWGGVHPAVIGKGGGGLRHPDMRTALFMGFAAMTLLAILLLLSRASLAIAKARFSRAEERAAGLGLLDEA